ncbi:MAG: M23 family peptidase, partial [Prevotella sp.]|nr:M23 family peptidase [Prevotella sp.]
MMLSNLILAVVTYLSPVHFDVVLAGNFGEPRPNHFHGGLDIKTQKVEGKAVYSIGDGYVCRVTKNV